MDKYVKIKSQELGMPFGTACARLRKMVMFDLVKKLGLNVCHLCKVPIETLEMFTLDHKEPWLHRDPARFWDLNNIAFAHRKCNYGAGERKKSDHGTIWRYKKHKCRCVLCREAKRLTEQKYRFRKKLKKQHAGG